MGNKLAGSKVDMVNVSNKVEAGLVVGLVLFVASALIYPDISGYLQSTGNISDLFVCMFSVLADTSFSGGIGMILYWHSLRQDAGPARIGYYLLGFGFCAIGILHS